MVLNFDGGFKSGKKQRLEKSTFPYASIPCSPRIFSFRLSSLVATFLFSASVFGLSPLLSGFSCVRRCYLFFGIFSLRQGLGPAGLCVAFGCPLGGGGVVLAFYEAANKAISAAICSSRRSTLALLLFGASSMTGDTHSDLSGLLEELRICPRVDLDRPLGRAIVLSVLMQLLCFDVGDVPLCF